MVSGLVHRRQERCRTQGWRPLLCPGYGELLFFVNTLLFPVTSPVRRKVFVQILLKCIRLVRQLHTDMEDTDQKEIGDWWNVDCKIIT